MAAKEVKLKKSEILRSKIYKHSIDLFTENGFENVKISDICETLGISTGTFYYYFPSKEAVLLEYARVSDEIMDEFFENLDCSSCTVKLKKLVVEKVKIFSVAGQKLSNVCMAAFLKHLDDSSLDTQRSTYHYIRRTIEEGQNCGEFKTELSPETLTGMLRYLMGGLAFHWTCCPSVFNVDAEAEKLAENFISTIKI